MTTFALKMKTNYMIALNAQWKAPWRMPKVDGPIIAKVFGGSNKFKNILGRTVKGLQNFFSKKACLND
jgi:hypothetical protein